MVKIMQAISLKKCIFGSENIVQLIFYTVTFVRTIIIEVFWGFFVFKGKVTCLEQTSCLIIQSVFPVAMFAH